MLIFLIFSTLFSGHQAQAQVKMQLRVDPISAHAGDTVKVSVDLSISTPHHVLTDVLKLKIENPEGFVLGKLSATPVKMFFDRFSNKNRETLEDQGTVTADLQVPSTIGAGKRVLNFLFTYQACSVKYCLFPKTVPLQAEIAILATTMNPGSSAVSDADGATSSGFSSSNGFAKALARGKFWAYLFVFIGGILTSFTPCIFPMIPITISIIGAKAAQDKKSRAFALSLCYVLGIAVTYSMLGVLAASTGAFFGAFLGNIWVVGFVALVFLIMGLSMLGLFELQAPTFLRNSLGTAKVGSGFIGAFFVGLVSGLVASPCIGPVLVGILTYVAQSATAGHPQIFFGFTLLFTFAIGMGLIFLVLGTFSGLMSKLPRSGMWMSKIKIVFGLALIAMAFYYTMPFWSKLKGLPVSGSTTQVEARKTSSVMNWQNYSDDLVKQAKTNNQPVIVDFGADWCLACHELDDRTYLDPKVGEASKTFMLLRVDATQQTPENEALQKKYNVIGLPTVLFINANGDVVKSLSITGFVKADEFLRRMAKVK